MWGHQGVWMRCTAAPARVRVCGLGSCSRCAPCPCTAYAPPPLSYHHPWFIEPHHLSFRAARLPLSQVLRFHSYNRFTRKPNRRNQLLPLQDGIITLHGTDFSKDIMEQVC